MCNWRWFHGFVLYAELGICLWNFYETTWRTENLLEDAGTELSYRSLPLSPIVSINLQASVLDSYNSMLEQGGGTWSYYETLEKLEWKKQKVQKIEREKDFDYFIKIICKMIIKK